MEFYTNLTDLTSGEVLEPITSTSHSLINSHGRLLLRHELASRSLSFLFESSIAYMVSSWMVVLPDLVLLSLLSTLESRVEHIDRIYLLQQDYKTVPVVLINANCTLKVNSSGAVLFRGFRILDLTRNQIKLELPSGFSPGDYSRPGRKVVIVQGDIVALALEVLTKLPDLPEENG